MFRGIIVDDDEVCRALFRQYCESVSNIELVGSFADPREALHFARYNPFELAVLDVMMPEMDGMELCRRLKQVNPNLVPIVATSSREYALQAFQVRAVDYLLKPLEAKSVCAALERAKRLCPAAGRLLTVRTFGHFDVFSHGKPLKFSRQKSKEILAYLIDRRGGIATVDQIIASLWEDRAGDAGVRTSYQTAFKDLRKDLAQVGAAGILLSNRNQKAVDVNGLDCDYYRMLQGDEDALNAFPGQYMADYSWAEPTNAHCLELKARYDERQTAD